MLFKTVLILILNNKIYIILILIPIGHHLIFQSRIYNLIFNSLIHFLKKIILLLFRIIAILFKSLSGYNIIVIII